MSRLYIHGHDEAEGAHRARLPAVPLPGLSAAVQRADRPPRSTIARTRPTSCCSPCCGVSGTSSASADVVALLLQRGDAVTHETIRNWEFRFAPLLADRLRAKRRGHAGRSWYLDETDGNVAGRWCSRYRAIDREGVLLDSMRSAHRDKHAARRFLRRLVDVAERKPPRVTPDAHPPYRRAIRWILGRTVRPRCNQSWNNRDLPPQNRSRSCARIRAGAKGVGMARKRYAAEEIIGKLREAEGVLAQGESVAPVARRLGVAEPTDYRGRREDGGLRVDQAKRLKERERENRRRKRVVADQALANAMGRDGAAGTFCARPRGAGRHPPARTRTRCRSGGPARSPARRGRPSAPCPGRPRMRRR